MTSPRDRVIIAAVALVNAWTARESQWNVLASCGCPEDQCEHFEEILATSGSCDQPENDLRSAVSAYMSQNLT